MSQRHIIDRHFRIALDGAPDGVLIEADEHIAYINPAYAAMLGYPSTTELADATIAEIADPEDFERLRWFGVCRRQGKPAPTRYTFRARARGGAVVTFDASISHTRADGDLLIMTIVRELQPAAGRTMLDLPGTKRLSPRELEVVQHLLAGKRSKEIAALLNVSEKTVDTHRSRVFAKMALRGVGDLFRVAAERGMI
jgi:PAS domain S-box-containing protein